tara:strand:- start:2087 stop:3310 length:1224 start_codon:yes stop_codon:yes gene_type:complete
MATVFKTLTNNDITTTRTLLHEAIPITGSIISGTYNAAGAVALGSEANIKTYSHGMFESVYDYPYLSSSANHIIDITLGYSTSSAENDADNTQNSKKINIYTELAQVLAGYNTDNNILRFDEDGNISDGGTKIDECFFLNFSRLLAKDEIKKGSFNLELGVGAPFQENPASQYTMQSRILITDYSGTSGYKVNSPAGEYGILYATGAAIQGVTDLTTTLGPLWTGSATVNDAFNDDGRVAVGLLYYQAGIAVVSGSVFNGNQIGGILDPVLCSSSYLGSNTYGSPLAGDTNTQGGGFYSVTGTSINAMSNAIRNRIYNVSFNNTTELNSTIYFCRANHNDFNYSTNPTYLAESKIRVKNTSTDSPVSYATTVGLYSSDNALLAVAKLSEPLKKTPETELTLRVRLDY